MTPPTASEALATLDDVRPGYVFAKRMKAALPALIEVVRAAERSPCEHDLVPDTKREINNGTACRRCLALARLTRELTEEGA
jgi:hypothetical protein